LREGEEDSILFKKMLNESGKEEYKASDAMGKYNSTESLFLALIFQQHKMISQLIDRLQNINKENRN
jgi:hypothetical protein